MSSSYGEAHHDNFIRSSPLPPDHSLDSPHFGNTQLGFPHDIPQSSTETYMTPLPPKKTAIFFVEVALNHPCCLMNFVHRPSLLEMVENSYDDNDLASYGPGAMALVYGFSAIGALFSGSRIGEENEASPAG